MAMYYDIAQISRQNGIKIRGLYNSFEEALALCAGYENDDVASSVALNFAMTLAQKNDKSDQMEPVKHSRVVSELLFIHSKERLSKMAVLDVGGSVGPHYRETRDKTDINIDTPWVVVESPRMAREIRELKANHPSQFDGLEVYDDIGALPKRRYNAIICSNVLNFVRCPYEFLCNVTKLDHDYLLIDRFPYLNPIGLHLSDLVSIQNVPRGLYKNPYGSPRLRDSDCPKYIASLIDNLVKRSDKLRECIPS